MLTKWHHIRSFRCIEIKKKCKGFLINVILYFSCRFLRMNTIALVCVAICLTFSLASSLCYHGKGMVSVLSNMKTSLNSIHKRSKNVCNIQNETCSQIDFICLQQCAYDLNQFAYVCDTKIQL